jgi:hypothetical protein
VDYILVYNNLVTVPIYIVVYSFGTRALQIRIKEGDYCSFDNEYHSCASGCDGHYDQMCMACGQNESFVGYNAFEKLTIPGSYTTEFFEILKILGDSISP